MQLLMLVTIACATAVPPLSDDQRRQLATARDQGALLDEGALYPLLENTLQWRGGPGDEAGAVVPDYDAIGATPADHRGRLCLIEGRLMRSQDPGRFSRSGLWEGVWRQWVIQWGPDDGDVAVVYLVGPPTQTPLRRSVRVPARFYKIWRDVDQHDRQTDYQVFVGRSATVVSTGRGESAWTRTFAVGAALLGLAVAYLVLRRKVTAMSPAAPFGRRAAARHRDDSGQDDGNRSLPDDPAEALDQLHRRAAKENQG